MSFDWFGLTGQQLIGLALVVVAVLFGGGKAVAAGGRKLLAAVRKSGQPSRPVDRVPDPAGRMATDKEFDEMLGRAAGHYDKLLIVNAELRAELERVNGELQRLAGSLVSLERKDIPEPGADA